MSWASSRVGLRAKIVKTFHSHSSTCVYGSALVGREGVVVAVLRNGTTALVKLDDDPHDLPLGVQRWPLRWDDLDLKEPIGVASPPAYMTGWSKTGPTVELHAVDANTKVAVCSSPAEPLPMCGWSVTFSPEAPRACRKCVALISGS
ncbi:hypothetical protein [Nonomuraea candida]|uniref:hypothetical protein n=1 Tax=Nonomuraea candida TaxID=359159 RepID=UPI0005B82DE2|nr:hypothetical protein [Nonomuraea candida]